jgi:hypothetical protein
MASVRKEILIDARLDGDDRVVTFFNGAVVRELLVDLDDDARRLVWSVKQTLEAAARSPSPDGNIRSVP